MASGSTNLSSLIPVFKGENFDYWSERMETLLRAQELWEFVEKEALKVGGDDARSKEIEKKDAKALAFIQQGLSETVFPRISGIKSAHKAWNALKTVFQGNAKVKTVRLQSLRRDFENLSMGSNESVSLYLARVKEVVLKLTSVGDDIKEEVVVAKILRSLTPKFEYIAAVLEETKDLTTLTFDELMGSLLSHEDRVMRSQDRMDDKAFHGGEQANWSNSGRGRGTSSTRGRGGRSSWVEQRRCYNCNQQGHMKRNCPELIRDYAKLAEDQGEEENYLFMAQSDEVTNYVAGWYVDSGCSNHMT